MVCRLGIHRNDDYLRLLLDVLHFHLVVTVHVPNSTQRVVNILREQIDQTRSGDHAETQNMQ